MNQSKNTTKPKDIQSCLFERPQLLDMLPRTPPYCGPQRPPNYEARPPPHPSSIHYMELLERHLHEDATKPKTQVAINEFAICDDPIANISHRTVAQHVLLNGGNTPTGWAPSGI